MSQGNKAVPITETIGLPNADDVGANLTARIDQLTRGFHQRVNHAIARARAEWQQTPPNLPAIRIDYNIYMSTAVKDEIVAELKARGWAVGDIVINETGGINALILIPS